MTRPPVGARPPEPILTFDRSITDKIAAGSEASFILDQQVLWLGTQLVVHLSILLKTARIHERSNNAVAQSVEPLLALLRTLAQEQGVMLRLQNDFLFLGERHLRMSAQHVGIFMEFIDQLGALRIGAVAFTPAVSATDLVEFAYALTTREGERPTFAIAHARLAAAGVDGLQIQEAQPLTVRVGERNRQGKLLAHSMYTRAAQLLGVATQCVNEGRPYSLKHAKRVIHTLVDLLTDDPSIPLALTTLRCYDQYTHNHSVNVSILAIALANRAGYDRVALADLGVGALFHDIGKSSIPLEILNKPSDLSESEWELMRDHPAEGVVCMARLRGISGLSGRIAAASFEHHMKFDGTGYPSLPVPWKQSLTARIISIADAYDAMTSSRVYRRTPMPAPAALEWMLVHGTAFDPILLKLFVNAVGIAPIGSLVMLDTGELAVVSRIAGAEHGPDRPYVRLVTDAEGNLVDGEEVSLAEVDGEGRPVRTVARFVDNTLYSFDTSRLLV